MKHWDAADRGSRRVGACLAAPTRSSALVLAPHYSALSIARLPDAARGGARRPRASCASSRAGTTSPASSSSSPTASAAPTRTSSSPRTRCRRGSSPAGDPYRDQLLETSRLVAEAAGLTRVELLLPERVADRRAVARPRHPRPPRGAAPAGRRERPRVSRSVSSPTTSRSAGISTSRRRRRRPSSACSSRGSRCRTQIRSSYGRLRGS